MTPFRVGANKLDNGEVVFDLQKEYHHVINRLVEWEVVLGKFQEQLRLRDEKIALLEERVAQLSLEIQNEKRDS